MVRTSFAAALRAKLLSVVTKRPTELRLVGGDPALDLANTLDGSVEEPIESLVDYGDLVDWALYAGVIEEPIAGDHPAALARVHRLRAVVYDVFLAVASREEPDAADLAELAAFAAEAAAHARLVPAGPGFAFAWDGDDPDRILWPLASSALDLLRAGPLDRVKRCHQCRWLFIDTSRNRSRRWCSMDECGVRIKMRRYRSKASR
jgi:predicted RNA-binding Zn ribbon-like protein